MEKITQMTKKMDRNVRLKQLILVIGVLVLIILILFQLSKVKRIEVAGNVRYSDTEIMEMLNIQCGDNMIDVLFNNKNTNQKRLYIKEANIEYSGFNKINIEVVEKDIIGYIPYMNKYLCLDYEGYIIDYTKDVVKDIPIIEGIEINDFTVSEKLDVNYKVIEAFIMFYGIKKDYSLNITKIKLENGDIHNIVLKVDHVEVIFGSSDRSSDKVKVMIEILKNVPKDMSGSIDLSKDLTKVIFKKSK